MQDCCRKGFLWNGTAVGQETTLKIQDPDIELNVYVTGNNSDKAVLFNHDALGWKFNNTRLLADHFAKEIGATVYLPDFFHGDWIDHNKISMKVEDGKVEMVTDPSLDIGIWFASQAPDIRLPEIVGVARVLKEKHKKLSATGYCWGGSVGFKLAAKKYAGIFESISVAHSGTPTEDEVKDISTPFQILAAQWDPTFPVEIMDFCNKEIPKIGIDYAYQYFPNMVHGFATKCDENKPEEKKALELAKNAVVYWIVNHIEK